MCIRDSITTGDGEAFSWNNIRMLIDSSGDVLIGQTSQTGYTFAQKLVVGDGDANDGITIQSGSTHQGNLAFNHSDGTTAHGRILYQHNTNYMAFFTNNAEKMRITSAGTMGFGQGSGSLAGSLIINNDGATGSINNAYYNTGYGWEVFDDLTSGDSNTVMGNQAGYKLAAGSSNTFIGKSAGEQTVDATENTAMGKDSLKDNQSGNGNTAIGVESLSNLQNGSENVGVGKLSGFTGTGFANNTFVGYQAGRMVTGTSNTYLGHTAGRNARAGGENVAIGKEALLSGTNSDAANNVAIGVVVDIVVAYDVVVVNVMMHLKKMIKTRIIIRDICQSFSKSQGGETITSSPKIWGFSAMPK